MYWNIVLQHGGVENSNLFFARNGKTGIGFSVLEEVFHHLAMNISCKMRTWLSILSPLVIWLFSGRSFVPSGNDGPHLSDMLAWLRGAAPGTLLLSGNNGLMELYS